MIALAVGALRIIGALVIAALIVAWALSLARLFFIADARKGGWRQ